MFLLLFLVLLCGDDVTAWMVYQIIDVMFVLVEQYEPGGSAQLRVRFHEGCHSKYCTTKSRHVEASELR